MRTRSASRRGDREFFSQFFYILPEKEVMKPSKCFAHPDARTIEWRDGKYGGATASAGIRLAQVRILTTDTGNTSGTNRKQEKAGI
jgi:hypothetical protein